MFQERYGTPLLLNIQVIGGPKMKHYLKACSPKNPLNWGSL
jgi:hypothetical protein